MSYFAKTLCVLFLSSFLGAQTIYAQYYNTDIEAKILSVTKGQFTEYTATVQNKTSISFDLRYEFATITKDSASGKSTKKSQEDLFSLGVNQNLVLGTTTIDQSQQNQITLLLLVYNQEDKLLGTDRIVINDPENKDQAEDDVPIANDGIVLRGIVVEDTKTKAGRDFYKMFDSNYRLSQINSEKIVTIKEVFGLGRNTNIEVRLDGKSIFTFFVNPRNDYLKSRAQQTMTRLRQYLQREQTLKNRIQRF